MSTRDVDLQLTKLAAAIVANDQKSALENGLALLSGFLTDVRRLADAMEHVARSMPVQPK